MYSMDYVRKKTSFYISVDANIYNLQILDVYTMYLVSEQKIKSVNIFHDPLGKSCKWWAYSFSLQRAHWGAETVAEVSGKDVNTTHKKNTALTILEPLFRIYTFSVFKKLHYILFLAVM